MHIFRLIKESNFCKTKKRKMQYKNYIFDKKKIMELSKCDRSNIRNIEGRLNIWTFSTKLINNFKPKRLTKLRYGRCV